MDDYEGLQRYFITLQKELSSLIKDLLKLVDKKSRISLHVFASLKKKSNYFCSHLPESNALSNFLDILNSLDVSILFPNKTVSRKEAGKNRGFVMGSLKLLETALWPLITSLNEIRSDFVQALRLMFEYKLQCLNILDDIEDRFCRLLPTENGLELEARDQFLLEYNDPQDLLIVWRSVHHSIMEDDEDVRLRSI